MKFFSPLMITELTDTNIRLNVGTFVEQIFMEYLLLTREVSS